MASTTNIVEGSLPQQMQEHTYPIMYQIEETHWWFAGRRRIISGFVEHICSSLEKQPPHILDVGCGTGANLELLSRPMLLLFAGNAGCKKCDRVKQNICLTRMPRSI